MISPCSHWSQWNDDLSFFGFFFFGLLEVYKTVLPVYTTSCSLHEFFLGSGGNAGFPMNQRLPVEILPYISLLLYCWVYICMCLAQISCQASIGLPQASCGSTCSPQTQVWMNNGFYVMCLEKCSVNQIRYYYCTHGHIIVFCTVLRSEQKVVSDPIPFWSEDVSLCVSCHNHSHKRQSCSHISFKWALLVGDFPTLDIMFAVAAVFEPIEQTPLVKFCYVLLVCLSPRRFWARWQFDWQLYSVLQQIPLKPNYSSICL